MLRGPLQMKWSCRRGLAVIALLFLVTLEPAAAEAKRVVLLHSFGQDFKPWNDYARTIRSELQRQSPWQLDITDLSLVAARFSDEDPEVPFVAYLRALFAKQPPDLIVSIGAPAAAFIQRHRPDLFPNTPIVFTAVAQLRIQPSRLTENDAVVAITQNFPAIIENILHVLPDTKTVAVVTGDSPLERLWLEILGKEFAQFADRLTFIWYNDRSFRDILKHAAALPHHSAIFWHQMNVDAAGVAHEGHKALPTLYAVANAPIFSFTDAFFGDGVIGGPMNSVAEASRLAATVAVRILGGEKAGDIKTPSIGFATPKFDWREMRRWGISESRLPHGSEILFREPTMWERYRWLITSVIVALLVQAVMITWLWLERFGRRKAETRSRKLSLEVMHLSRAAEAGALSASFAHDLGQPTLAIALNAQRAETLLSKERLDVDRAKEAVIDISRANDHAAAVIKQFQKLLKRRSDPEIQHEADLNAVIADALSILSPEADHRHVVLVAERHKRPLLVSADPIHILQVLLNLATNAMDAMADNPSGARRVAISTAMYTDSKVEIVVRDSGPGIPEQMMGEIFDTFYTTKQHGTGLGLSIARTIVDTYGGEIWAENKFEGGAAFHFTIPLSTDEPAQRKASRQTSVRVHAEA
jgi:signal transduction histidine kinase